MADGAVGDVGLINSSLHPLLDQAAIRAVKSRFKYLPGTVDGKPATAWTNMNAMFFASRNPAGTANSCHSVPVVGSETMLTPASADETIHTQQWIKIMEDGTIADVLVETQNGWMHMSEAMIGEVNAHTKFPPAKPQERPAICWMSDSLALTAQKQ